MAAVGSVDATVGNGCGPNGNGAVGSGAWSVHSQVVLVMPVTQAGERNVLL